MFRTQGYTREEKSTKTGEGEKAELCQIAEKLKNNCHIPDWVQSFPKENGGLNIVLRCNKPPTCMIVV